MKKIGVLALQGDFAEHIAALHRCDAQAVEVRLPVHLDGLDGLIIPGGESTTIGKLALAYGLMEPLRQFGSQKAIWGTCAGAIFLSKDVYRQQPLLGLMDITVRRNAFGRQVDSFEADLDVPALKQVDPQGGAYHMLFIRAPLIDSVGEGVQALAQLEDGCIVAAQQGRLLATSFHPELTLDDRFHRYFLALAG
ncbi:MAG: pyridoxal 5'-phosphate synthase glutaminase subunit PdxT [Anaerolineales bacterium]|nr:pyridoxal 5'-phosphate synthase glutaminase subunit PdxT [Anaerolineales bacterium]